ncbi:MAG: DUF4153 domain-containing protein [Alcanivorax sp.]
MKKLLERIFPVEELLNTVKRFPLSVACALSMFALAFLLTHGLFPIKESWLARIFAVLSCWYFWFGISQLIAESQNMRRAKRMIIDVIVGGAIFFLLWFSTLWAIHLAFVLPALLLGIMFAPYLTGGDDLSVWFFNRMMWFGVAVSYVALFMFAGGVSVALGAVQMLFEIKVGYKLYSDLWLFACFVLGPIYALSWVPKQFSFSPEDCNDPPGLRFIVNWITVPMVFVYLAILYAYFAKIVTTGEVPNGFLAYMITGFAGAGIVTYMIAWPMRESGSPQLRLFYKIFFPMLIIPVGVHFYAIWERISAYGLTEQRYMLLLSAIWLAIMATTNSMSRIPLKAIPATLCILMIFASFGPWGGVSLSGKSQFARLENLLVKYDILQSGKIVKTEGEIPFEDRKNISSIIDYLCRTERDAMIEPWFKGDQEKWSCGGVHNLTGEIGFDYVSKYGQPGKDMVASFYLRPKNQNFVEIDGYDILIKRLNVYVRRSNDGKPWKQEKKINDDYTLHLEYYTPWLNVRLNELEPIRVNMLSHIEDKIGKKPEEIDLNLEIDNKDAVYKLSFQSIRGKRINDEKQIENFSFDFLFRIKE